MVTAGFQGADVVALRVLARQMVAAAGQIAEVSVTTDRGLRETRWYGRDADAFRSDWATRWRPAMGTIGDVLDRTGRQLAREADQQDRASAAGVVTRLGSSSGAATESTPDGPSGSIGSAAGRARPSAATSVWARAAAQAWRTWQTWYGRLGTALGVAPYAATAIRWPDAPRVGPRTWTSLAEDWTRVHLPSTGLGRTLGALNVAGIASDGYQSVTAAMHGDGAEALDHGIPALLGAGTMVPNPAVRLVSLAGSAGWTIGSWIQGPINNSAAGIWIGDHIVGPAGDALIDAWHTSEHAVAGAWEHANEALFGDSSNGQSMPHGAGR